MLIHSFGLVVQEGFIARPVCFSNRVNFGLAAGVSRGIESVTI